MPDTVERVPPSPATGAALPRTGRSRSVAGGRRAMASIDLGALRANLKTLRGRLREGVEFL